MLGELLMAGQGLKTSVDMAKALIETRDALIRDRAAADLYKELLAAYHAHLTALDRVREMEGKLHALEDWERQKQRYQLERHEPGTFLQALKPEMAEGEPTHYACPKCFEHRKRSILTWRAENAGQTLWYCHECTSQFWVGRRRREPIDYPTGSAF